MDLPHAVVLHETDIAVALPRLPVGTYRLEFRSDAPLQHARLTGSAWRGTFGHALKRATCVTHEPDCRACLLYRSCAYPYVFHTPPPLGARKMRRYEAVPHPFVLRPAQTHAADETAANLYLTVFGEGNRHLALLVYAFQRAASDGKGVGGMRLQPVRVWQERTPGCEDWTVIHEAGGMLDPLPPSLPAPPEVPGALEITLDTPLRVKRDGHHVGPEEFRFGDFFGSLLRRISMLTYFHTDTPLETDFRRLRERARLVEVQAELAWRDITRYSSRQKTRMRMGGLLGGIRIEHQDLAPFWPYLWLGQWAHAGAATTMGLGHYRLATLRKQTRASGGA